MNLKETFNTRLPPHNFNSQEIEYVLKASDPGSQSIKIKDSNGNSTENSHNIDKFQIQELKNSSSYKEILNYRSGDYFKERRSSEKVNLNSSFCEGLSLNQKKTLSMSGKITSSKICYSDL